VEHRCPTVPLRRLLLEKVPFLLLTVGSCVITYLAQQQGGAVSGLKAVPLSFRIANALSSYTGYLAKTVWPTELAVIYPLPAVIPVAGAILSALVLVGVSALVLRQLRQRPWLAAGWFWYLGTLVPVIGLVQVGQQAMADRYTYIPLLGIFIMVAWGVADLCRRLRLPAPATSLAVVLMLGALALVTWRQASHWKDGITLFSHTTRVVAGNHVGYRLLGIALSREGRFAEAEQAFQAALRARPDDDDAITEWGINLKEAGRPAEAAQQFSEALRLNPSHLFARLHLAQLLKDEGRLPEAIREYQLLSRQYPDRYYVQNGLGSAYLEAGDTERALLHFRRALELDPANAEILYNLGLAAGMGGNMPASIDYLTRALALRPGFAEAHYNLGSALARSGDFGRAADHFAAALRINPAFAEARRALELARSRSGGSPP
jgi:Flp pilus assembly protein TadD